jgi:DNA-binding HxlR family transcriptional regulator
MRSTVTRPQAGHKRVLSSTRSPVAARRETSPRERAGCPLYTAIGVIEGRWKPMLFQRLADRPHGFGELRRAMPGVAPKVLREQLRQMQADDLVSRLALGPAHAGVLYGLTPYGLTLGPVFDALWKWGSRHLARADARRGTIVQPPRSALSEAESAPLEAIERRSVSPVPRRN